MQSVEVLCGWLCVSLLMIGMLLLLVFVDFMVVYLEIEFDIDFSDWIVDVIDEGFDVVLCIGYLIDF